MNHFVPDFDTDDDYTNPISSSMNLPRKPTMAENDENDLMELLWHNGQVVLHNQSNQRFKKPPSTSDGGDAGGGGEAPAPVSDQNLFIQEDEMSSWLHYPLREDDFCSDLLFNSVSSTSQPQNVSNAPIVSSAPNAPNVSNAPNVANAQNVSNQTSQITTAKPPVRNFINFSRFRGNLTGGKNESGPSISKSIVRESTQVNPSEADLTRIDVNRETVNCGTSSVLAGGNDFNFEVNRKGKAVATAKMTAVTAGEISGASSSVISKAEIEPIYVEPATETATATVNEKKRKEREAIDETESRSEETRPGRGSTSTKRSRAAEVHNLSERKRRDRINERMKALQELIPRCNKSDKASMLDEAIEYMKSLQLQVQMMSMGCGMMPMMYMSHHMAMTMNQHPPPFIPYPPNILPSQRPNLATQQQSHHINNMNSIYLGGPRFHQPIPIPNNLHTSVDQSRVYTPNHHQTTDNPMYNQHMNHHHFQQFSTGLNNPTQPFQFQNLESSQPSSSRPSSSKESKDPGR